MSFIDSFTLVSLRMGFAFCFVEGDVLRRAQTHFVRALFEAQSKNQVEDATSAATTHTQRGDGNDT